MKNLILIISLSTAFSTAFANTKVGGGGWRGMDTFRVSEGHELSTFDGVNGSGSGPRPSANALVGGSGGGGGPRPHVDYIQTIKLDQYEVEFKYKGFDTKEIKVEKLPVIDVDQRFLDAIKDSFSDKAWKPVQFDMN